LFACVDSLGVSCLDIVIGMSRVSMALITGKSSPLRGLPISVHAVVESIIALFWRVCTLDTCRYLKVDEVETGCCWWINWGKGGDNPPITGG